MAIHVYFCFFSSQKTKVQRFHWVKKSWKETFIWTTYLEEQTPRRTRWLSNARSQVYLPKVDWTFASGKSVKTHMKRVLDDTKLTFEEFSTILSQIEACVNSRPMFAVSNDPADLSALTPGNFLIGRLLVPQTRIGPCYANPLSAKWNFHHSQVVCADCSIELQWSSVLWSQWTSTYGLSEDEREHLSMRPPSAIDHGLQYLFVANWDLQSNR